MTLPTEPAPPPQPRRDASRILFWLLAPVALALGYAVITRLGVGIGDEDVHRFQIDWFLQGKYELFEHVTVLPLYHLVVAALAQFSGLTSLNGLRLVHMVFAAAAIPAFFALCRALYPAQAAGRTAQFMFIPILFPLFFLTYTDLPALAFTFLMLERTFRRKYLWAAVFALVAVAMRQTNIIWVAFAFGLVALQVAGDLAGSSPPGASGNRRAMPALEVVAGNPAQGALPDRGVPWVRGLRPLERRGGDRGCGATPGSAEPFQPVLLPAGGLCAVFAVQPGATGQYPPPAGAPSLAGAGPACLLFRVLPYLRAPAQVQQLLPGVLPPQLVPALHQRRHGNPHRGLHSHGVDGAELCHRRRGQ